MKKIFLVALLCASSAYAGSPLSKADTLSYQGSLLTISLSELAGLSVSIGTGCVGTFTPKFSTDDGVTYAGSSVNPPFILPLASNSARGTLTVPAGADHAGIEFTTRTSGSCLVRIRTAGSVPSHNQISVSGTLSAATADVTSATGNFVALPIDPTRWASATLTFSSGAFTGTLIWDMMVNGQWVAAPYATLTSTASANPATVASKAYADVAVANTWDLPLPGNVTAVRVRSSAVAANSVVATLTPGRPYVPGVPVTATLYDVTSVFGVANGPGATQVGGWTSITHAIESVETGGTGSRSIQLGAIFPTGDIVAVVGSAITAIAGHRTYMSRAATAQGASATIGLSDRMYFNITAGDATGGTTKYLITATR